MIKGIGVDLIETKRFRDQEDIDDFLEQILTEKELQDVSKESTMKQIAGARVFAVKEAIFKALACGLQRGSYWHDIEVGSEIICRPGGYINGLVTKNSISRIHVTESHSRSFRIAFVITEE